jgi:Na+/melibiose symporter-like transporter
MLCRLCGFHVKISVLYFAAVLFMLSTWHIKFNRLKGKLHKKIIENMQVAETIFAIEFMQSRVS